MSDSLYVRLSPQPPSLKPVIWAVASSVLLHSLAFGVLQVGGFALIDALDASKPLQSLTTKNLAVTLIESSDLNQQTKSAAAQGLNKTGFTWVNMPTPAAKAVLKPVAIKPRVKLPPKPKPPPPAEPTPTLAPATIPAPVAATAPALTSATPEAAPPVIESLTKVSDVVPSNIEPLPAIDTASASSAVDTGASVSVTPQSAEPSSSPGSTTTQGNTYQLPQQVKIRYETSYQGFPAHSELQWKKTGEVGAQRYEASLTTSAMGMEHQFKSLGIIGIKGLSPLGAEEKRPFKSAIATSVEPSNNRVIISSKEGFLPYDPLGHDIMSLMIQLGIYAASLPEWSKPGIAQDFTVYRPGGIRRWRFQSQGLDTIQVRGEVRQVVYIRRIASDGQPDYEDQYHFWLDPKQYGFPVKMRQVDNKGKATDIVMTDWKEQ
jgi:hypothetical protein